MKFKYIYILIFSFAIQFAFGQQNYTKEDFNKFVNVYMSFKVDKKRNSRVDKQIFERFNVTSDRYKQIAKAFISNKSIELNSNEDKLLAELKKQNEFVNKTNNQTLKSKCLENEISFQMYSEILYLYQKDMQFQRSLKPHFDAYIKQMK